jgi:hypothetical protein
MANIPDSLLKNWQQDEVVNASDYNKEREILKVAINDNFKRNQENNSQLSRHIASDDHDIRYYTKEQINANFSGDGDLLYEVFTITASDNGDGTFTYTDKEGLAQTGELTPEGYQVFTLNQGEVKNENRIEAFIDDTLHRSVISGGLKYISEHQIALTEPEEEGAEITFRYFEQVPINGSHKSSHENNGPDEIKGLLNLSETEPSRTFAGKLWGKVITNG